jgi:Uma2 family endonuclease
MAATIVNSLMTAEEFEAVAERLGACELVRGEVITLSPGGVPHSFLTASMVTLLGDWARRTHLGRVLTGEAGLITERDPDTVRGADVAYYSYERLPKGPLPKGFAAIPPNLVVEIIGEGQSWKQMLQKVGEYLRMGVDRVWVVDPQSQRVHVFRSDAEPIILSESDTIADEAILPGFSCSVEEFFAE